MGGYDEMLVPAEVSLAGMFGAFWLVYYLVVLAVCVGSYVLQGISFYSIASRRGIKHAWLSWVPLGSVWILGCISDQYQYVVKRQVKNKRKIMLGLSIAVMVLAILVLVLFGIMIANAVELEYSYGYREDQLAVGILGNVLGMTVASLVMSGLSIALTILEYIAFYDLYASCDPSDAVVYLILSIFLSFLLPILLFLCRKKDKGMPPKKPAPAQIPAEPAAWQPTDPMIKPEE